MNARGRATAEFFEALADRGHEPMLEKISGTIRFDLTEPRKRRAHWLVRVTKGDVDVSRRIARSDCVVRIDRALFDDIIGGRANALTAVMRGAVEIEGDTGLMLAFQKLFPGPPREGS